MHVGRGSTGAVLAAALLLAVNGCRIERRPAVHVNETYGFQLAYPDTLDLRQYTLEYAALGAVDDGAFQAAVEVLVEKGEGETFEAFATARARVACAADGPEVSFECTDVVAREPFTTEGGVRGQVMRFRHLTLRAGSDLVVAESERGPFYVFDLSERAPGEPHAALFVRAPVVLPPEGVDAGLIREVARSVRLVTPWPAS